jgi:hypothetical protein
MGGWELKLYKSGVEQGTIPVAADGSYEIVVLPGSGYSLKVEGTVDKHATSPTPQSDTFNMALNQRKTVDLILDKKWQVTTFAGSGISGILAGAAGSARFNRPTHINLWDGFLYVACRSNNAIMKVAISDGYTTILKQGGGLNDPFGIVPDGAGSLFTKNGANALYKIDSVSAVLTSFSSVPTDLSGIAIVGSYLYMADWVEQKIMRVDFPAGGAAQDFVGGPGSGTTDVPPKFNNISDVTAGGDFLYVVEYNNHAIRKVNTNTGEVTTLAGTKGTPGTQNGTGTNAQFTRPVGVMLDGVGNLYVTEEGTTIRKIEIATGKVTTLSLTGESFSAPHGMCVVNGDIYVSDYTQHKVMKMTQNW